MHLDDIERLRIQIGVDDLGERSAPNSPTTEVILWRYTAFGKCWESAKNDERHCDVPPCLPVPWRQGESNP